MLWLHRFVSAARFLLVRPLRIAGFTLLAIKEQEEEEAEQETLSVIIETMATSTISSAFNAVGDRVFVRDEHYAWLPATVVQLEEDRALVRIDWPSDWNKTTVLVGPSHPNAEAPQEQWVALCEYFNHQLPRQSDNTSCRDLADLSHLNEAIVLYQLKERHCRRLPYTRVGNIIVAVKPCQWIPDLYSRKQQRYYYQLFGSANQDYPNGTSVGLAYKR